MGLVTIAAFIIGTLLGVLAAWKRGTILDALPTVGGSFLGGTFPPYFWTALLLLFFLGYVGAPVPPHLRRLLGDHDTRPELGVHQGCALPRGTPGSDHADHLAGRLDHRHAQRDDHHPRRGPRDLRGGQRHPPGRTVALKYAARNAILPNLTGFGMALGGVVGGSVLVEQVFGYPGIGFLLFNAVTGQDYPLMQAIFLMITVSVLIANLLVDIMYGILDPRTRR